MGLITPLKRHGVVASNHSRLFDPELWELRADEARVIAEKMRSPEAKAMMATVIETCDQLAQRAVVLQELRTLCHERHSRCPAHGRMCRLHQGSARHFTVSVLPR
jgi:hypothetical protein